MANIEIKSIAGEKRLTTEDLAQVKGGGKVYPKVEIAVTSTYTRRR